MSEWKGQSRFLGGSAAAGALVALASCAAHTPAPTSLPAPPARPRLVAVTPAPPNGEREGLEWVKVEVPGLGVLKAPVARPQGQGPFSAIIILHGSHGFAQEYVRLAEAMARNGVVGVAACWFSGGGGAGSRFITPIECPEAPPISSASSPSAQRTIEALVQAVRTLPGVRADRVALFGHSRGGGAVLQYILGGGVVQAAVLNSAGYPQDLVPRAAELRVPLLMLHGISDSPSEGGSTFTDVGMARAFEAALRRAGRLVEVAYYDGGHNSIFTSTAQYDDEVERIAGFLRRYLTN